MVVFGEYFNAEGLGQFENVAFSLKVIFQSLEPVFFLKYCSDHCIFQVVKLRQFPKCFRVSCFP